MYEAVRMREANLRIPSFEINGFKVCNSPKPRILQHIYNLNFQPLIDEFPAPFLAIRKNRFLQKTGVQESHFCEGGESVVNHKKTDYY